ncbi:hypothetical protein A3K63_04895 [Candidatus Micrarchaeota archaeon RBG_16_49_10]|nr:MAG: hypothetical protein A3K63_04895 [Candidatus Micrarchaeota archaeon RBG_16_49_10]
MGKVTIPQAYSDFLFGKYRLYIEPKDYSSPYGIGGVLARYGLSEKDIPFAVHSAQQYGGSYQPDRVYVQPPSQQDAVMTFGSVVQLSLPFTLTVLDSVGHLNPEGKKRKKTKTK